MVELGMNRFMLLLGACGLLASIVVHLLTFFSGSPVEMGQVWPLHVILFIPFLAMIVRLKVLQPPGMVRTAILVDGADPES